MPKLCNSNGRQILKNWKKSKSRSPKNFCSARKNEAASNSLRHKYTQIATQKARNVNRTSHDPREKNSWDIRFLSSSAHFYVNKRSSCAWPNWAHSCKNSLRFISTKCLRGVNESNKIRRSAHFMWTKSAPAPGRTGGPRAKVIRISSIFEKIETSKMPTDFPAWQIFRRSIFDTFDFWTPIATIISTRFRWKPPIHQKFRSRASPCTVFGSFLKNAFRTLFFLFLLWFAQKSRN